MALTEQQVQARVAAGDFNVADEVLTSNSSQLKVALVRSTDKRVTDLGQQIDNQISQLGQLQQAPRPQPNAVQDQKNRIEDSLHQLYDASQWLQLMNLASRIQGGNAQPQMMGRLLQNFRVNLTTMRSNPLIRKMTMTAQQRDQNSPAMVNNPLLQQQAAQRDPSSPLARALSTSFPASPNVSAARQAAAHHAEESHDRLMEFGTMLASPTVGAAALHLGFHAIMAPMMDGLKKAASDFDNAMSGGDEEPDFNPQPSWVQTNR